MQAPLAPAAAATSAPSVQRIEATVQRDGDEEEVQGSFESERPVQREEAEEEEGG